MNISCGVFLDAALEPRNGSPERLKSRVYDSHTTKQGPKPLSIIFYGARGGI